MVSQWTMSGDYPIGLGLRFKSLASILVAPLDGTTMAAACRPESNQSMGRQESFLSLEVERALGFFDGVASHRMSVDHSRFQIAVSKEVLNSSYVVSIL